MHSSRKKYRLKRFDHLFLLMFPDHQAFRPIPLIVTCKGPMFCAANPILMAELKLSTPRREYSRFIKDRITLNRRKKSDKIAVE
jgi:hypothetical protein